jgi:hypothetical protein
MKRDCISRNQILIVLDIHLCKILLVCAQHCGNIVTLHIKEEKQ